MTSILHLTSDSAPDCANHAPDAMAQLPHPDFEHSVLNVSPVHDLPQSLPADILVIHFTVSWRNLTWLHGLRARNPRAMLILVEHTHTRAYEQQHVPNRIRFRAMLRLAYGVMDRVVAVSEAQGAWMREVAYLPGGSLVVINPHADIARLRALQPPVRQGGPFRLCAYGRFAPQQGFDMLIDAMKLVSPELATLRLAGKGPDEAMLRARAAGLPHVSVEAAWSRPEALLEGADAVVIPSRFEAFGTAGLQARAAARPIIVSAVDGLAGQALPPPELTVPPEDPPALARAILWLAKQDLAPLAATARASAGGTETQAIRQWNRLLSDVAARRQWRRLEAA